MIFMTIFVCVVLLLVVWYVVLYNSLMRKGTMVKEAWSGIEAQLKRRHDLIPRLVETAKGYMAHERDIFEELADKRAQSLAAGTVKQKTEAENALTASLRSLFAIAESYPDLKASQPMMELQRQLGEVEDQIQLARRYYNGTVREYNVGIITFPGNVVASMYSFRQAEFFELGEPGEREAPDVKF